MVNPASSEEHTEPAASQPPAKSQPKPASSHQASSSFAAHLPPLTGAVQPSRTKAFATPSAPPPPPPHLLDGFEQASPPAGPYAQLSGSPRPSARPAPPAAPGSTAATKLSGSAHLAGAAAATSAAAAAAAAGGQHGAPSTPYWWRPHLSKLPGLKQQQPLSSGQGGQALAGQYAGQATGLDAALMRGESPSGQPSLVSLHSQLDTLSGQLPGDLGSAGGQPTPKTGAWLLVVGGLVAVVVAFLIVCSLFACTNCLFFPSKRKSAGSTSGSSGTATLPLNGLRSQLIGSTLGGGQQPFLGHQYQMQTHLQYTQPHYEYPLQHTIIK